MYTPVLYESRSAVCLWRFQLVPLTPGSDLQRELLNGMVRHRAEHYEANGNNKTSRDENSVENVLRFLELAATKLTRMCKNHKNSWGCWGECYLPTIPSDSIHCAGWMPHTGGPERSIPTTSLQEFKDIALACVQAQAS